MEDCVRRCDWAQHSQIEQEYHDRYWGIPVHDEQELFSMLLLEGQQAGLSWKIILDKKIALCAAFDDFVPERLAVYDEQKMVQLLQNEKIIRNRQKIRAAVTNAQAYFHLCEAQGSLENFFWSFVDFQPITHHWQSAAEVPAHTELSDQISKELKRYGFKFVGSTIVYSFMQAVGMVNDHLVDCFRYRAVSKLKSRASVKGGLLHDER